LPQLVSESNVNKIALQEVAFFLYLKLLSSKLRILVNKITKNMLYFVKIQVI